MTSAKAPAGARHPETATDLALKLPVPPPRPIADTKVLISEEEQVFAQCEAAVENLKRAFWAAGKALQVIRDGRLYRATHDRFEDYCLERWGMVRGQANKLIRMWPIAEALFESQSDQSNDSARIRARKLGQSAVWELVPVAETYDVSAAQMVYQVATEASEAPVTAEVLQAVVRALPKGSKGSAFDTAAAEQTIRSVLQRLPVTKKRQPRARQDSGPVGDTELLLPWGSPEALDRLLREHMTPEDRAVLAKLLAVD
jgi:hypothetical protein